MDPYSYAFQIGSSCLGGAVKTYTHSLTLVWRLYLCRLHELLGASCMWVSWRGCGSRWGREARGAGTLCTFSILTWKELYVDIVPLMLFLLFHVKLLLISSLPAFDASCGLRTCVMRARACLPVRRCICGRTSALSLDGLMSTVLFCSLWVKLFILLPFPPRLFLPAKQMQTCFQIKMSTAIFERAAPQSTSPSQMHPGVLQSSQTGWFFSPFTAPTRHSQQQLTATWNNKALLRYTIEIEIHNWKKKRGTGPDLCWVQTHHIGVFLMQ